MTAAERAESSAPMEPAAAAAASASATDPSVASAAVSPPPGAQKSSQDAKRRALLAKITQMEERGAILAADAHTLRRQLLDGASGGEWAAAERRLEQLALSWNPYQDVSADDRSDARKRKRSASDAAEAAKAVKKPKKKRDFYELLKLAGDRSKITAEDIKKQFRKLALRLHPDKQRAAAAKLNEPEEQKVGEAVKREDKSGDKDVNATSPDDQDDVEFARLLVAYETLSDPDRRAAYDAKLADLAAGKGNSDIAGGEVVGKDQIKLEASTDFASLEWMARVKHKMDVMDRIAEWAKILGINATEIRFETGEPCTGRGCGKIVTMDRDLECYGSPRRRVYVCLLHKYIHACDELCTSRFGDTELDKKVCPMRAYWLVQNWLYDQLHTNLAKPPSTTAIEVKLEEESKQAEIDVNARPVKVEHSSEASSPALPMTIEQPPCLLVASEIHLGDYHTRFHIEKLSECKRKTCSTRFQFLEDGIYACRRHGSPHVCTYEQCDRKHLVQGRYVCWVSGRVYGSQREEAGTGVRMRKLVYSDANGDENAIDMEVPVMLPIGKMTSYLLEGHQPGGQQDISSLSPPPPDEKTWHTKSSSAPSRGRRSRDDTSEGYGSDEQSPRRIVKRVKTERETSPVRARIHQRLSRKMEEAEQTAFSIYLKLPAAVANLPRVALELQETEGGDDEDDDDDGEDSLVNPKPEKEKLLPIRVHARHTVNYIKYYMEGLTEQQISIWDQQVFWGDTLIGEEAKVMMLEEHGIHAGCVLELRLHDDCPLLVSAWNESSAAGPTASAAPTEYNTIQISKEAEEDLDDLHEEWENVIAVEEEAFERDLLERKRERMEQLGVLHHTELIQYDGETPKLLGVIPTNRKGLSQRLLKSKTTRQGVIKINQDFVKEQASDARKREAMRGVADEATLLHVPTARTKIPKKEPKEEGEA